MKQNRFPLRTRRMIAEDDRMPRAVRVPVVPTLIGTLAAMGVASAVLSMI